MQRSINHEIGSTPRVDPRLQNSLPLFQNTSQSSTQHSVGTWIFYLQHSFVQHPWFLEITSQLYYYVLHTFTLLLTFRTPSNCRQFKVFRSGVYGAILHCRNLQ